MTDPITGRATSWLRIARDYLALALFFSAIFLPVASLVGVGFMQIRGDQVRAFLQVASSTDVEHILAQVESLAQDVRDSNAEVQTEIGAMKRAIAIAARPDDLVIYRDPPETVADTCRAGEDCTLVIEASRHPLAEECVLDVPRTVLLLQIAGRDYEASPALRNAGANLTAQPTTREPTFRLPLSLPAGTARATLRTYYYDCPWQGGGPRRDQPPAYQNSPSFTIEVVR